jgi:hypothetical protein
LELHVGKQARSQTPAKPRGVEERLNRVDNAMFVTRMRRKSKQTNMATKYRNPIYEENAKKTK